MPEIHVCCGVGGVGKTTAAAAMAVGLAQRGRRVAVLTIDPARRLADALGVSLGNDPQEVAIPGSPGSLHALMLDRKATFDGVIRRFAPDPDTAQRLLENRYYRAVSKRLSGSHEYMAMEKLLELADDGRFDTLVLDTPPTRHALDFLKAPDRMRRLMDPRVLAALTLPSRSFFAVASRSVLALVARLAGESVLEDLREFFGLLSGLSTGFRDRGARVRDLLAAADTRFWLVVAADSPERDDALGFLDLLREQRLHFAGFVINRVAVDPDPDPIPVVPAPGGVDPVRWQEALGGLASLHHARRARVMRQEGAISRLLERAPHSTVIRLPERADGLDDLVEIERLGHTLAEIIALGHRP